MTLIEQIENQARQLPPEKQKEALDFISFLQQRISHPASNQAERQERLRKAFEVLANWDLC